MPNKSFMFTACFSDQFFDEVRIMVVGVSFVGGVFGGGKDVKQVRCCCRRRGGKAVVLSAESLWEEERGRDVDKYVPQGLVDDEDLQDDEEYMVVEGKDLNKLLDDLIQSGRDAKLGEEMDEDNENDDTAESAEADLEYTREYSDEEERQTAESVLKAYKNRDTEEKEFFTKDNMKYLPRWAQELHENGAWKQFVQESESFSYSFDGLGSRSLDHLVNANDAELSGGIEGLSIADIASDYRLPIELVVEEMFKLGAGLPLKPTELIKDCLEWDQIKELVFVVTSFDAADLESKYSDNTIRELAFDYDVAVEMLITMCNDDGFYLAMGEETHLLKTQEDLLTTRLEIMLGLD